MSPFNALKHLVYFEKLAETEEGTEAWNTTTAGLVVLRLLDSWYDFGPQSVRENGRGVKNIRAAIDAIDEGNPIRYILGGLVDTVERSKPKDVTNIIPRLMAYGRALDYESSYSLANDVFQTVLDYASPEEDAHLIIDAHMQMGYCLRMMGAWEEAAHAYAQAGQVASALGDMDRILRARIADAKLAIDRGNLPQAEALLEDTIEASRKSEELTELRSIALHDRAAVAYMRGEFEASVKYGYDALSEMQNPIARDRVLADIAVAFSELGVLSAARDALVIVAATAQEVYLRWVAQINLLEIAAKQGAEPAFESYRKELADTELPAALRANYHLHVGRGYMLFEKDEAARDELQQALAIATENKLNQLVFEAEKSLAEVGKRAKRDVWSEEASQEVADIARAISDMRMEAGLSI